MPLFHTCPSDLDWPEKKSKKRRIHGGIIILLATFVMAGAAMGESQIIRLSNAAFVMGKTTTPPPSTAAWRDTTLMDPWPLTRYQQGNNGWYRLDINLDSVPDKAWGIYLPRFNMNAAVFLNRQFLADGGRFEEPMARNWNRPLLVSTPTSLWRSGNNTLHIRLKSYPGHGYLSPVFVGPLSLLATENDFRQLLQVGFSKTLFPVTLIIGIFVLALWARRRHDSQYLWFALAVLTWSHYSANMFVRDIPIPTFAWEVLAYASVDWFGVFLAIFGLRFTGYRFGRRDILFLLFASAATLAYALSDQANIKSVARFWHAGAISIGTYVVVIMLRDAYRHHQRGVAMMALGLATILFTAVHDWMFQFGHISITGRTGFHLLHFSAPLIFTLMAWHLLRRFINALNEAETLNRELEQRIENKTHSLEQHYATIQEMEKRTAVLRERERLSREIHDGMSGNLANAIMMSELIERDLQNAATEKSRQRLQRLKGQLNNGLAEMRNLILAMEGDISTLGELINHLNEKCGQLFLDAGIDFKLCLTIKNEDRRLSQKQSLNILRILQEAANNIIKHSRATLATLHISEQGEGVHFHVSDNGCGFDMDSSKDGYGMGNMRKRAKEIDVQLQISSSPEKGTNLALQLPPEGG